MRTPESTVFDDSLDLETIQAVLREHPVRLAILFGSHVEGAAHPASDIDIAVEFEDESPTEPGYNDTFLGLSVDLSDALGTDALDLVDLHTVSSALATAIFENGVLLVGTQARAAELQRRLTATESPPKSHRDRLDTALDRIAAHLDDSEAEMPASGDTEDR